MLLRDYLGDLAGAEAVIIGRSNIVGKPMAQLLLGDQCTVTIAHSRSRDLASICRRADILVAAVGRPEMIRGGWIKPRGDSDRRRHSTGSRPATGRPGWSVTWPSPRPARSPGAITPVPGGVGPMTIACLLANTLTAARRINGPRLTGRENQRGNACHAHRLYERSAPGIRSLSHPARGLGRAGRRAPPAAGPSRSRPRSFRRSAGSIWLSWPATSIPAREASPTLMPWRAIWKSRWSTSPAITRAYDGDLTGLAAELHAAAWATEGRVFYLEQEVASLWVGGRTPPYPRLHPLDRLSDRGRSGRGDAARA